MKSGKCWGVGARGRRPAKRFLRTGGQKKSEKKNSDKKKSENSGKRGWLRALTHDV